MAIELSLCNKKYCMRLSISQSVAGVTYFYILAYYIAFQGKSHNIQKSCLDFKKTFSITNLKLNVVFENIRIICVSYCRLSFFLLFVRYSVCISICLVSWFLCLSVPPPILTSLLWRYCPCFLIIKFFIQRVWSIFLRSESFISILYIILRKRITRVLSSVRHLVIIRQAWKLWQTGTEQGAEIVFGSESIACMGLGSGFLLLMKEKSNTDPY